MSELLVEGRYYLLISLRDEVVIFGTGIDAVKCAYMLRNRGIYVKYFLNNNKKIEFFLECPVYEPSECILDGVFVIIAVGTTSTYLKLARQLDGLNLEEFTNYIYYKWIDRKLVLLHGNCHMTVIESYLQSSKEFSDNYAIYPNPLIYENEEGRIADKVLNNCDIWIHEDIKEDNAYGYFLSDAYIRFKWGIRGGKKEITIPHLFGLGKAFFPQSACNQRNRAINNAKDTNGMFPHADTIIDRCVEDGMTVEEIIAFCESDLSLKEESILSNFEKYMGKIKEREKAWDIKIYDFIIEKYKKVKLFYDEGHPTNIILEKICKDILYELGIVEEYIYSDIILDTHENPVYPAVKHCLQLEWSEAEIRRSFCAKKMCCYMDFEEYIREYLWWCYGI